LVAGTHLEGTYAVVAQLVPPGAPQISFLGEFFGIHLAGRASNQPPLPITVKSDCAAAIAGLAHFATWGSVSRNRKWDVLWGDLQADTANIARTTYVKVKAHRSLRHLDASDDSADLIGNHVADRAADHIVAAYSSPSAGEAYSRSIKLWKAHSSAVLSRLEQVRNALPPVPRPAAGKKFALSFMRRHSSVPLKDQHDITWATPYRPMCSK
jgi:hypothetical protein